jgi:hypothetical protein
LASSPSPPIKSSASPVSGRRQPETRMPHYETENPRAHGILQEAQVSDFLGNRALNMAPSNPQMTDLALGSSLSQSRKAASTGMPPVFHCRLDQSALSELKTNILALADARKRYGVAVNAANAARAEAESK